MNNTYHCMYCEKDSPAIECVERIYDGYDGDELGYRFYKMVCPFCENEDWWSKKIEVDE